jgi:hypothetical protein
MKNYIKFRLNDEQLKAAEKIIEALISYNEALVNAFLKGEVPFEIRNKADLYFTLDAADSILFKEELWRNQCEEASKEMHSLDIILENNPEALSPVKEELENLKDAFTSCKSLMKLIED